MFSPKGRTTNQVFHFILFVKVKYDFYKYLHVSISIILKPRMYKAGALTHLKQIKLHVRKR